MDQGNSSSRDFKEFHQKFNSYLWSILEEYQDIRIRMGRLCATVEGAGKRRVFAATSPACP